LSLSGSGFRRKRLSRSMPVRDFRGRKVVAFSEFKDAAKFRELMLDEGKQAFLFVQKPKKGKSGLWEVVVLT